jgi:hypothetical protein
MPTNREKQKAHGAQSDQGDQEMRGPEPQQPAYEGPEETHQQRQTKARPHYPYEGKEGEADPGNLDSAR